MSLTVMSVKENRVSRWYFGGLASAGAACVTHPLDLLKVQMQTQKGKNISIFKLTGKVIKNDGKLLKTFILLTNYVYKQSSFINLRLVDITMHDVNNLKVCHIINN